MNGGDPRNPNQPPQHQEHQPGVENEMEPKPEAENKNYVGSGKLKNKIALISGGDSGIGRAVAIAFAKEGADLVITYLEEHEDALKTKEDIEKFGRNCVTMSGDIGDEKFCQKLITETMHIYGRLDILVNNAAEQHPQETLLDITAEQLIKTFSTNIFSYFYLTKAALPYLKSGSAIINSASVTSYKGSAKLLDYSATKGAIIAFTRSLSQALIEKNIRVNAVAPGPIWTPLIPASFSAEHVANFGKDTPMQRPAQPFEIAPSYVFLASEMDSSYFTGQVLHPNGGVIVNG